MTAMPVTGEAAAAARSLLAVHAGDAGHNMLLVELSAWLLGAAGERVPVPGDPTEALHARLAAAAGAGDMATVEALLETNAPDDMLLNSACELIGPNHPDRLIEAARRYPGRRFAGRMLATTSNPAQLLGLLPAEGPAGSHTIETVGELVIVGRDRGKPVHAAEARWKEIAAEAPTHLAAFRDLLLRITARESLDAAVALLVDFGDEWGRDRIFEGASAVISRLARVDAGQAAYLVGNCAWASDRVAWLDGLAWWLELVPPAVPIIEEVLGRGDPELDLAVARILTRTPELSLLDRALRGCAGLDPARLASSLATGVYQLRAGGRHEVADRVRLRCLDAISAEPSEGLGRAPQVQAADVFEVIAAPGPALVPWASAVSGP